MAAGLRLKNKYRFLIPIPTNNKNATEFIGSVFLDKKLTAGHLYYDGQKAVSILSKYECF